jgi:hypothetical protein
VELEMARTSSSRRSNAFSSLAALLLLGAVSLGLAGCGNDNPADSGGTMTVDLRGIKNQLGNGFSTQDTGVAGSTATTAVRSLIIGAVVITFSDSPLSETTQIDSGIEDKFASDVINSINFLSIVDLPTGENFVEFKVPPPSAGHWQVAAIGTKNRIERFQDLDDANVAIYYGFDDQFHTTSSGSQPDVSITMNRACFIDEPPLGCAQYTSLTTAVVSGSGTIVSFYNGENEGTRTGLPATATATLLTSTVKTANAGAFAAGNTVTVVATHPADPFYIANCSGYTYTTGRTLTALKSDPCVGLFSTRF